MSKQIGADVAEESADTLGGLIYSKLGHVPVQGEAVEVAGWRFIVLALDGRRIDQVRAEPVAETSAKTDATAQESVAGGETQTNGTSVLNYSMFD